MLYKYVIYIINIVRIYILFLKIYFDMIDYIYRFLLYVLYTIFTMSFLWINHKTLNNLFLRTIKIFLIKKAMVFTDKTKWASFNKVHLILLG